MSELFETLHTYFSFPFVQYAFITGILIAVCSSLLGVTLVLKRLSFIGDGLSHVAFGAMACASVLNLTQKMYIILPVTVITAILLLRSNGKKIKGDASIAIVSVGSLAAGYLLINLFSKSANVSGDVCSTLFGSTSILTLTKNDVYLCCILSAFVIVFFLYFYNAIFTVTFDEAFAKSQGVKTDFYNFMIAVVIAVIIVLAMNLAGSLLISALIIFPSLSAMKLFRSFKSVTIASVIFSLTGAVTGLLTAIIAGTPVGATIVGCDALIFLICSAASLYIRR